MPRGRFGAVFFRKGAVTGRGIRIGSTLAQLRRAYPNLSSRLDRYIHGGRDYFLRRAHAPHWELRVDVNSAKRVTQTAFGERISVRLDEGCAYARLRKGYAVSQPSRYAVGSRLGTRAYAAPPSIVSSSTLAP
jgi:hypothetical protein